MNYLEKKEQKLINTFLKKGYVIGKVENKKSLNDINQLIKKSLLKLDIFKEKKIDLNKFHKINKIKDLNKDRISIINFINSDKKFRLNYLNLAREHLYAIAGNELMMQKNINLSIQLPNDKSSLLPVHSDVWSGDSPYEINLWIPLVNCFKTKSMYILNKKNYSHFLKQMKKKKIKSSYQIFNLIKNKIKFINIKYGEFLIFDQTLPHGNIVNDENQTRWSMNCRFKSIFSPYGDKKVGEFFTPITTRATTYIGQNYKHPF
tara:strand:- start:31515 stop:32297 length:783 start_codon:yes stop_codon:yes gene_type:complete